LSNHSDFAFLRALQNGARVHHWPIGDTQFADGFLLMDAASIVALAQVLQRET